MKKTLMVVDDAIFIFEEMKLMLEGSDFEIIGHAKSGEEALALFDALMPDIVTMDIILPGMDGMETSELLLKKWPEATIIAISSLGYDESIQRAASIGIKDFLFKPFEKEQLLASLLKGLES